MSENIGAWNNIPSGGGQNHFMNLPSTLKCDSFAFNPGETTTLTTKHNGDHPKIKYAQNSLKMQRVKAVFAWEKGI
jgi:hypothetical protein